MNQYDEPKNTYQPGSKMLEKRKPGTLSKLSFAFSIASIAFSLVMLLLLVSYTPTKTFGRDPTFRMMMVLCSFAANLGGTAVITGIISAILGKKHDATISLSITGIVIGAISFIISFAFIITM